VGPLLFGRNWQVLGYPCLRLAGAGRGKVVEVFWAGKVVAKGRGMVYNVWTYRRFAKKRYGMSGGRSFKSIF